MGGVTNTTCIYIIYTMYIYNYIYTRPYPWLYSHGIYMSKRMVVRLVYDAITVEKHMTIILFSRSFFQAEIWNMKWNMKYEIQNMAYGI